jgi:hypothetical protein
VPFGGWRHRSRVPTSRLRSRAAIPGGLSATRLRFPRRGIASLGEPELTFTQGTYCQTANSLRVRRAHPRERKQARRRTASKP